MTFILRILALMSGFLGFVSFVLPILMINHGTSPIRDAIASIILIAIAIVAVRCTKWLWRKRRFWTEINSLSEVSAFGCLILLWPIDVFLEQKTDSFAKGAVQIATVVIAVSVYLFVRRISKAKGLSSLES